MGREKRTQQMPQRQWYRLMLNTIDLDGVVVIGEGEIDEARCYTTEKTG
jgi:fructose-1,6-bisphosphatase/sedoheptulose 1,7-bisphosphatase-like protein